MTVTLKISMALPSGKSEVRRFTTSESEVYPALIKYLEATYSPVYQSPLHFVVQYDVRSHIYMHGQASRCSIRDRAREVGNDRSEFE
jgi:hypothetical protein